MPRLDMDLTDVPEGMGFDPIPAGVYLAHIVDSKDAETKAGDSQVVFTLMVLEGAHEGAKLFDRIMLSGSDKAVNFGRRKMKTMAMAMNYPNPNYLEDSEDLHGRPCRVRVGLRTYNDQEQNEIKDYLSADSPPRAAAPATAPPAASPPSGRPASVPPQAASPAPPPPRNAAGQTSAAYSPPPSGLTNGAPKAPGRPGSPFEQPGAPAA